MSQSISNSKTGFQSVMPGFSHNAETGNCEIRFYKSFDYS